MAVVLTPVQTKQIRINIHKRNNTKTQYKQEQNIVNTSTHITKTTTTHITKTTSTHITKSTRTHITKTTSTHITKTTTTHITKTTSTHITKSTRTHITETPKNMQKSKFRSVRVFTSSELL